MTMTFKCQPTNSHMRRPRLHGETFFCLPELPRVCQFFIAFPYKLCMANLSKRKKSSMTHLAETPSLVGRVTLLDGSNFLPIDCLPRPSGPTRSRWVNQSMRERSCSVKDWQRGPFFSHINAGTRFLHITGASEKRCLLIKLRELLYLTLTPGLLGLYWNPLKFTADLPVKYDQSECFRNQLKPCKVDQCKILLRL